MTATATQYPYIQLSEADVPIIAGTTMKVIELVTGQIAYGWSPEELHFQHPYLTMSQIYSALAYYWDHKEALDAHIARREKFAQQLRQQTGKSVLAQKIRNQGLVE